MTTDDYLTKFINGVYSDLGEPEDYSQARLWAWFLDNSNLGKLNNWIGTQFESVCYKDSNGVPTGIAISPIPTNDQLAVYKLVFTAQYYSDQAISFARSAATKGRDWISLSEGDSHITKVNPNEVAKTFKGLYNDAYASLKDAVKMYLKYNAVPDQVAGDDTQGVSHYIIYEYSRILH